MNQIDQKTLSCDSHSAKEAVVMKYEQDGTVQFECLKCFGNDQTSRRQFIYLEDLLDQQSEQLIDNWPPLYNESYFKQVQDIRNKQQQQNILKNFISQIDYLEKQVIDRFQEYKKSFINQYECMNGEQVMIKWNEISQIAQFKQIFQSKEIDRNIIKQFLQDQINNISSNSKLIEDEIQIYKDQKPQNLDQLNILCKNIHFQFDNISKKEQVSNIQDLIQQLQNALKVQNSIISSIIQQIVQDDSRNYRNQPHFDQLEKQFELKTIKKISCVQVKGAETNQILRIFKLNKQRLVFAYGIDLRVFCNLNSRELKNNIKQKTNVEGWWICFKFNSSKSNIKLSFSNNITQIFEDKNVMKTKCENQNDESTQHNIKLQRKLALGLCLQNILNQVEIMEQNQ